MGTMRRRAPRPQCFAEKRSVAFRPWTAPRRHVSENSQGSFRDIADEWDTPQSHEKTSVLRFFPGSVVPTEVALGAGQPKVLDVVGTPLCLRHHVIKVQVRRVGGSSANLAHRAMGIQQTLLPVPLCLGCHVRHLYRIARTVIASRDSPPQRGCRRQSTKRGTRKLGLRSHWS